MMLTDQGMEMVDNSYFITEDNVGVLKQAKEANSILVSFHRPHYQIFLLF